MLLAPTVLLGTSACLRGPDPVATSADVDRDPLADLDPEQWNARGADDLLALPVDGDPGDHPAWSGLGLTADDLTGARQELIDFLDTALLDPEAMRGLDDAAAREQVLASTPEYWLEDVGAAWDEGQRYTASLAFAEPFRAVGRPAIGADWYLGQFDEDPSLMLAGTVAWSVIDTATRAVGAVAYRFGVNSRLNDDGGIDNALFRVTFHGMDICRMNEETGGLVVPTIGDSADDRSTQEKLLTGVIESPRISREQIEDEHSAVLSGTDGDNVYCD